MIFCYVEIYSKIMQSLYKVKNKLLKMLVNGQATFFLLKFIRFGFASAEMSSAPVLDLTSPSLCLVLLLGAWC